MQKTKFRIVNETQHVWAEQFLQSWLDVAELELVVLLGKAPRVSIPIVVSTHTRHAQRFPPAVEEDLELAGDQEVGEARGTERGARNRCSAVVVVRTRRVL